MKGGRGHKTGKKWWRPLWTAPYHKYPSQAVHEKCAFHEERLIQQSNFKVNIVIQSYKIHSINTYYGYFLIEK